MNPLEHENGDVQKLKRVWNELGDADPLWAVLSRSDKRGGRWNLADFLNTGQLEIEAQMEALSGIGLPHRRAVAVDFGCGVGRLTRALATYFERVIGIDISPSMIATARAINADISNVTFEENTSSRLASIGDGSVDLVFSHLALQHIPARLAKDYVAEFLRVLAPGGVAVFQFVESPDRSFYGRLLRAFPNSWLSPLRRMRWRTRAVFEMHSLPSMEVLQILDCWPRMSLIRDLDDPSAGAGWNGRRWYVANREELPEEVLINECRVAISPSDQAFELLGVDAQREGAIAQNIRKVLRSGSTFLDVGPKTGAFAMLAASIVGSSGRVIAVEPLARNCRLISRSAALNGFRQVRIIEALASDSASEVELCSHPNTSHTASPAAAGVVLSSHDASRLKVKSLILDQELHDLPALDMVRVRLAGNEPKALLGMKLLIDRFKPVLIVRLNPWALRREGENPEAFFDWIRQRYRTVEAWGNDGSLQSCVTLESALTFASLNYDRNARDAGSDAFHIDLVARN